MGPTAINPDADRLVRVVLAGDTTAYTELVRMYEAEVWRIAATLLRHRAATEDIVQQTFVDAYTHLDQYRLGTDFGAWVRTVAWNRLRKELRSAVREDRRLEAYRDRLAARLRAEAPSRDHNDDYLAALRGCRDQLPESEQSLIGLRYDQGLSFETIAARRDQTPEAVQRMISRIRFRLRDCVERKLGQ